METPQGPAVATIDPFQALCFADKYIIERDWHKAMSCLLAILQTCADAPPYIVKRAARLYAEINGALPNGDTHKQEAAAVQLLVLSRVKANEWLGTQGVAADMLKVELTRIGNVEMNYATRMPLLIQADNYCWACQAADAALQCSACKTAFYCCAKHQRDDWPMHKIACATSRARAVVWWNDTKPFADHLAKVRETIADTLSI